MRKQFQLQFESYEPWILPAVQNGFRWFHNSVPSPKKALMEAPRVLPPVRYHAPTVKKSTFDFIDPIAYANLYHDIYNRFLKSPQKMGFVAVIHDPTHPDKIEIRQFCYQKLLNDAYAVKKTSDDNNQLKRVFIPDIKPLEKFTALKDSSNEIILNGYTRDCGTLMTGRPLCTINIDRANGSESPQKFVFYSMIPNRYKAQVHIKKFSPAIEKKLEKLQDYFTLYGDLEMVNTDVAKRAAIKKRDPDQKTVMGYPARKAWVIAKSLFSDFGTPEFINLLENTIKILHPMTIKAREMRGEKVSEEEKKSTQLHLSSLLEWLHLIGFRLSPLYFNPQQKSNLASARAAHNTEMILLESLFNLIASSAPESKNRLTGQFKLVPFTKMIDTGHICFSSEIGDTTLTVKQNFNALVRDPEELCIGDVPGFIGMVMMLLQGQRASSVHTATIIPTEPVLVNPNNSHCVDLSLRDDAEDDCFSENENLRRHAALRAMKFQKPACSSRQRANKGVNPKINCKTPLFDRYAIYTRASDTPVNDISHEFVTTYA